MYQKKIKEIIIHHTFSVDHPDILDWDGIRKYHIGLGWNDIGYHYGIERVNNNLLVLRGRPDFVQGAHCLGRNFESLGVAVVGNFDIAAPDDETMKRLASLCYMLKQKHPDIKDISPHSKYSIKTCPGKLFDMDNLLERVKSYG